MPHQRIIHVQFASDPDWDLARARLEAITAETSAAERVDDLHLVRVDDVAAVVLVASADAEALARFCRAVIDPWLVEQHLVVLPPVMQGETIFRRGPPAHDEASHLDGLDDAGRCELFVRRVVETGTVWGLHGQTWARSSAAGELTEALPLWPDAVTAARCIAGPWQGFVPQPIELQAFVEQWLGGMAEDGIVAIVLPTPTYPGAIVAPGTLADALRRRGS